jgi:copper oxidase (laccase) domain-containing protein
MANAFGSDPAQCVAAIGPAILACCYTVGTEVRERFEAQFAYASELFPSGPSTAAAGTGLRLDLHLANHRQLENAGLPVASIHTAGGCTAHNPRQYFSHRASGGHAGRMMAVIGIRN